MITRTNLLEQCIIANIEYTQKKIILLIQGVASFIDINVLYEHTR